MPDSIPVGEPATFYFSLNVGVWTGTESYDDDVVIDELYLEGEPASSVMDESAAVVRDFELLGNYPNPFNPSTEIRYNLKKDSDACITLYNMTGQQVTQLINQRQSAGLHAVRWDGRDSHGQVAGNGVYICYMQAGIQSQTLKMILQK